MTPTALSRIAPRPHRFSQKCPPPGNSQAATRVPTGNAALAGGFDTASFVDQKKQAEHPSPIDKAGTIRVLAGDAEDNGCAQSEEKRGGEM